MELRIFTEPQQGASYEQLLRMAQAAERAGFAAFFRSDHFLRMGPGDPLPGPTESWVTLAGLARETSRIRLGTLVTSATFRFPGILAVQAAQIDVMSGGRVELGLGTGWFEEEHRAYGVPFPPLGERFDRLEEQLAIITGMWTTPVGKRFSFSGRHYTLADCPALPKPAQGPRPPVIVGGLGARRTPRLAARFADEFNLSFVPLDATELQFQRVRQACEEAGRDPASLRLSVGQTVCCGRDEAELARRAASIDRDPGGLRESGVAGTPDEVVARLRAFADLGAERFYLQILDVDDLDHLDLLAQEVMPQVA
jgi:F420-dependent oxidoreductase-like protein